MRNCNFVSISANLRKTKALYIYTQRSRLILEHFAKLERVANLSNNRDLSKGINEIS